MAVLLITYDLNREGSSRSDYTEILKQIKKTAWARLSESSYAIETSETPEQVFNRLQPHLDPNDYLTVITLNRPWYGRQSQTVLDWLKQRL
jgi:hypothetical protein